jgi:hypothetical protein
MMCVEEILVPSASGHLTSGHGIGIAHGCQGLPWGLVAVWAHYGRLVWADDMLDVRHVAYLVQHAWAERIARIQQGWARRCPVMHPEARDYLHQERSCVLTCYVWVIRTVIWVHRQAITSPHVADVIPRTLVYLERTYGWAIRMVEVASGLRVITRLNEC